MGRLQRLRRDGVSAPRCNASAWPSPPICRGSPVSDLRSHNPLSPAGVPEGAQGRDATTVSVQAEAVGQNLRAQMQAYATQRKDQAAKAAADVATAFKVTSKNLDGFPWIKASCERAARDVDAFADSLAQQSVGEITNAIGAAVRRRPGLAAATAVTAGAALFYVARRPELRGLLRRQVAPQIDSSPTPEA